MKNNFRKPGLLYPSQTTLALPNPAPFITRFRPTPYRTLTPATTREQRRALRAAEQAAWEASSPAAQLHLEAMQAAQDTPAEKTVFAVLLGLAAAGIAWGLLDTFHLVERWPAFVAAVRQLLG